MLNKNAKSDVRLLVLVRPADTLCALLSSVLRQQPYECSQHSTIFELISEIRDIPVSQPVILIARPAMLGAKAMRFLQQRFHNLRVVGWLDSGENVLDAAVVETTINGMMTVSHPDQLRQILQMLCETMPRDHLVPETSEVNSPEKSRKLEYELSDDEITALLGIE